MKQLAAAAALLLVAGCGSKPGPKPVPATTPADMHVAELQASMTELLERLDVMNDRIAKLEKANEERPATVTAPASVTPPRSPAPSTAVTPSSAVPPPSSPASGRSAGARRSPQNAVTAAQIANTYRTGIVLFGKNQFPEARATFQQVFDADQSGELADNALFWIGETYYATADYNNAIRFYKRVADEYGDQNKAPDAVYKLAMAYEKTGDLAQARTTLQEVIARYPYSSPAASAKTELNRIRY